MPRWRRVVAWTDGSRLDGFAGTEGGIGDALGQLYVAEFFPPESKARVLMVLSLIVMHQNGQLARIRI